MSEYWAGVAVIVIGVLLAVIICLIPMERVEYIYECTDYKGDLIYCKDAYWTKGGMLGKTEDGTTITITSYKRILKHERNEENERTNQRNNETK